VPVAPYRLPGAGRDGVLVSREGALLRVVHVEGEAAVVRAWVAGARVRLRAESRTRVGALAAIERIRFALCTDHDLRDFHRRLRRDPLIGPWCGTGRGCVRAAGRSPSRRWPGRSASS
jgi:hypothetical protein